VDPAGPALMEKGGPDLMKNGHSTFVQHSILNIAAWIKAATLALKARGE
jgi:hypothetical protein